MQFPLASKDNGAAAMAARPASDLYLTMAKAMGAGSVTFPGQTGMLSGVLS